MASSRETGVKPADFQEFDIVIVGGGTAGLAVASRLAKSSADLSVGVLEAGLWRPDDDKINIPAFIGQSLMQPEYDWQYMTTPQKHSNDRQYPWPRGKVLGGSSALNFLVWQRGSSAEFDAWKKLGPNPGWDWKSLERCFKKSATILPPSTQLQKDNLASIEPEMHGSDGPVQVSFSAWYTDTQKHWMSALKTLGLDQNVDGLRGDNSGVWLSPATLDQKNWRRSYAASAHYEPNRHLPNLKVITDARATKVILTEGSNGEKKATGVEYQQAGEKHVVKARKEVILSGGTVNSPALLEHSGIGAPEVLKKAGVPVQVDLPGVGRNLQEHLYTCNTYELNGEVTTWDNMGKSEFAAAAMESYKGQGEDKGILASAFSGFAFIPISKLLSSDEISSIKTEIKDTIKEGKYYKNDIERLSSEEFLRQLDDDRIPEIEYIFAPGYFGSASGPEPNKNYFSILTALQHPFSRGEIHITDSNPLTPPSIDPNYFSSKADLEVLAKGVEWCERIVSSPALSQYINKRQDPNPEKYKTSQDFQEFVKDTASTEYHHIGTCSMTTKEKGGVVDEKLKVHGVQNLRVIDASIMPLMPSSHIVAVVYAIAEKGAEIILNELKGQSFQEVVDGVKNVKV
ncbi:unnamed protein product [Sympodiomycopsis kandeliae]